MPEARAGPSAGLRPDEVKTMRRFFLPICLLVPAAAFATPPGVELLLSTESQVDLEIDLADPTFRSTPDGWVTELAGYGRLGEMGAPELPTDGFFLAIPHGTTPRLRILEVELGLEVAGRPRPVATETIHPAEGDGVPTSEFRTVPDDVIYGGRGPYPAAAASLGDPVRMRHQRIVPVHIRPVVWDRDTDHLRAARRILLRVDFVAASGLDDADGERPVPSGGPWERTYESQILNYEEGKSWRRAPASSLSVREKALGGTGPRAKLRVSSTGPVRITFDALRTAGLAQASVPWNALAIHDSWYVEDFEGDPFRRQPIPYIREDQDGDGTFEAGESLVFYAQDRWDRFDLPEGERRFGRIHTYWITWNAEPPVSMADSLSWRDWTGLTPPESFVARQIAEKDSIYAKAAASEDLPSQLSRGRETIVTSHSYWTDFKGFQTFRAGFTLPRGARLLELTTLLHGVIRPAPSGGSYRFDLNLAAKKAGGGPATLYPFPGNPYSFLGQKLEQRITLGKEDLEGVVPVFVPEGMAVTIRSNPLGMCIDKILLTYERPFLADAGLFSFHTEGLAGPQEIRVDGFGSGDVYVLDVTDPTAPARLPLSPEQVRSTAEGFEVALQIDAGDSSSSRSFLLVERGRVPAAAAGSITIRETTDLTAAGDEDFVAIFYGAFASALEPLLAHRESQGHRVLRVDVEDVYDVFNGGRTSPVPIRDFLRYLFHTRPEPPAYLLLVGDGSDDHARIDPWADFNFLPVMTLPSTASSTEGPELVANDDWFVENLSGTGEAIPFVPEMHVGRLPAGTEAELQTMVAKIIRYEDFQPGDSWRNRGIFYSDDQYSSSISFDENYTYRGIEEIFERGSLACISKIFSDTIMTQSDTTVVGARLFDFEADRFFISNWLDTLRTTERCYKDSGGPGLVCGTAHGDLPCGYDEEGDYRLCPAANYEACNRWGEGPGRGLLLQTLSRGGLFWNVESHANKNLIGHEFAFRNSPGLREDVLAIQNLNKPFLFMGYGCHLAEFSDWRENFGPPYSVKDGIGERLLFHGTPTQSLGAVGSVASTGYEWLGQNDELNTAIFDAFFVDNLRPEGAPRWIFGEVFTQGKMNLVARGSTNRGMLLTYAYLGDPALRMDIAPARLRVEVDGSELEEGMGLAAATPDDSVRVDVWVHDEATVGGLRVDDYEGTLPAEAITRLPDPERPADDRAFVAHFDLELRPDTYSVTLRTTDGAGQERVRILPVSLDMSYQIRSEAGDVPLAEGALLPDNTRIVVDVRSPVFLVAGDFEVLADGLPWDAEPQAAGDVIGDASRHWRIVTEPFLGLPQGEHRLTVRIAHEDGKTVTEGSIGFAPGSALEILDVFTFPNPFEEETEFRYRLSNDGDRARLSLYTVKGKLIEAMDDLPARINENIVRWDGRDADGDPVSNGLYFYRLQVWGFSGDAVTRIEKVVRAR